jgi:surface protein
MSANDSASKNHRKRAVMAVSLVVSMLCGLSLVFSGDAGAMAATVVESGMWGTTPWTLDDSGVLTLGQDGRTTTMGSRDGKPSQLDAVGSAVASIVIAQGATVQLVKSTTSVPVYEAGPFGGFPNVVSIDLNGLTNVSATDLSRLFAKDSKLESVSIPKGVVTSGVTNLSYLFVEDASLTVLDVSNFDTSNVIDFSFVFFYNPELRTIVGLQNWDVSKGQTFRYMFCNDRSITALDLTGWATPAATDLSWMFATMMNLNTVLIPDFSTAAVKDARGLYRMFSDSPLVQQIQLGDGFTFSPNGIAASNVFNEVSVQLGSVLDGDYASGGSVVTRSLKIPSVLDGSLYFTGLWQSVGDGSVGHPNGSQVVTEGELIALPAGQASGTWVWQPLPVRYDTVKVPSTGAGTLTNDLAFGGDGENGLNYDGMKTTREAGFATSVEAASEGCASPSPSLVPRFHTENIPCTGILGIDRTYLNADGSFFTYQKATGIGAKFSAPNSPADSSGKSSIVVSTQGAAAGLYSVKVSYQTNLPSQAVASYDQATDYFSTSYTLSDFVYVQAQPTASDAVASASVDSAGSADAQMMIANEAAADHDVPTGVAANPAVLGPNGPGSVRVLAAGSIVRVTAGEVRDAEGDTIAGFSIAPADAADASKGVVVTVPRAASSGVYAFDVTYTDDVGQSVTVTDTLTVTQVHQAEEPEPNKPKEPNQPQKPDNPGKPDGPQEPDNPGKPGKPGKPAAPHKPMRPRKAREPHPVRPAEQLPPTGTDSFSAAIVAVTMLVMGCGAVAIGAVRRKR